MYLQFEDGVQCVVEYRTADGRMHEFRGIADEFFAQHHDKMGSHRLGNVLLLFGGAERQPEPKARWWRIFTDLFWSKSWNPAQ
jgi:hypothetical protein